MKTPEEWAELIWLPCHCKRGGVPMTDCSHRRNSANIVRHAISEAVAAEREACAQEVMNNPEAKELIAAAIRARKP